ncbi:MAG: Arm DNA-binding domain-containing protein, partial [Myxococcales bacterium]
MARKMAFITRSLLALKPGAEVYEVREAGGEDSRGSGLRLRVHPSGTKTFRWPCRSLNRVFTLGTFGDGSQGTITLAEAHRRLDQYRARVKAGIDPEGFEGEERPRTIKQLCALFYEEEIAKHRKRPEDAKWVLDNQIVPVLGNVPLAALDTMACRRLVTKIRDRGQH